MASGTASRETNLRDLTRSVAAALVEQAMKVIVDVDMVGMTLDGAGFQCAVVCRARSSRKLQTSVDSTRWQLPKTPSRSLIGQSWRAVNMDRRDEKYPFLVNPTIACKVSP